MSDNLPEPPMIVLAINMREYIAPDAKEFPRRWWIWSEELQMFGRFDTSNQLLPSNQFIVGNYLTVIPHPRNDERAVALINGAKGA